MRVTVDGELVEVTGGSTVLHALAGAGFELPSLCDDGRLAPYGECRMCLVHIEGRPQPVAACAEAVEEGMAIETAPADLESARRGTLAMLARGYPAEAAAAEPDLPLHALLRRYDVEAVGRADPDRCDDSHPCIAIDMNRCIDCFRCVRICDELQGQFGVADLGAGRRHACRAERQRHAGVEPVRVVRGVRRHVPLRRARPTARSSRWGHRRAGPAVRARTAGWGASCWSARATNGSSPWCRRSTRRSIGGTHASRAVTRTGSYTRRIASPRR